MFSKEYVSNDDRTDWGALQASLEPHAAPKRSRNRLRQALLGLRVGLTLGLSLGTWKIAFELLLGPMRAWPRVPERPIEPLPDGLVGFKELNTPSFTSKSSKNHRKSMKTKLYCPLVRASDALRAPSQHASSLEIPNSPLGT